MFDKKHATLEVRFGYCEDLKALMKSIYVVLLYVLMAPPKTLRSAPLPEQATVGLPCELKVAE